MREYKHPKKKKKQNKKKSQLHRSRQGALTMFSWCTIFLQFLLLQKSMKKCLLQKANLDHLTLKTYENVKIPLNKIFKEYQ
jgi:hypothetical protein